MAETDDPETDDPETDDPKTDDPETDDPETEGRDGHPRDWWGTDGWRRRMALGGKAWTEGSSVFMAFRPRDILLCHSSWPSQSRRRMAPRRMSPRRRKAALDGCPRDGGRPPETDVAEMDVPETEGVFLEALILSDLSECD